MTNEKLIQTILDNRTDQEIAAIAGAMLAQLDLARAVAVIMLWAVREENNLNELTVHIEEPQEFDVYKARIEE